MRFSAFTLSRASIGLAEGNNEIVGKSRITRNNSRLTPWIKGWFLKLTRQSKPMILQVMEQNRMIRMLINSSFKKTPDKLIGIMKKGKEKMSKNIQ